MSLLWLDAAPFRARRAMTPVFAAPGKAHAARAERSPTHVLAAHPANVLAHLAALFSILVLLSPGIDLLVSSWFVGAEGGFPLSEVGPLVAFRDLNRLLPPVFLTGLLALLIAQGLGFQSRGLPRPHAVLFVLAFYAAGPGLLVNGLKTLVGRARPRNIAEFGGMDVFTPAWYASDACFRNCSFPSGEAGSAVAMLALVFLLPKAWRRPAAYALVPFVLAFSLNRIAFGAHFVSDVVLSWLLCGAVMLSLRPVFAARADALDGAVTGALTRLGGGWRHRSAGLSRAA